tara:strand:- start:470 stop:1840 length:1371 start_codon:yes stop_codon:yes gene_type:complete
MCGIGGHYNQDGQHQPSIDLMLSWALLSARGIDASGALWRRLEEDKILYMKKPVRSYDWASQLWYDHLQQGQNLQYTLLHTRATTKGSAQNPLNNHPVKYESVMAVHNGVVSNDDDVFKKLGVTRFGEVDTEALSACLHIGGIEKVLELCAGSFSIAWIDRRDIDTVHLYTNGKSPLWITTDKGFVTWASAEKYAPLPMMGAEKHEVKAGTLLTITQTGIEEKDVGKEKTQRVFTVSYPYTWGDSGQRQLPTTNSRGYLDGDYTCYNNMCNVVDVHTHSSPNYNKTIHNHALKTDKINLQSVPKSPRLKPPYLGGVGALDGTVLPAILENMGSVDDFASVNILPSPTLLFSQGWREVLTFRRDCESCLEYTSYQLVEWLLEDVELRMYRNTKSDMVYMYAMRNNMPGFSPPKRANTSVGNLYIQKDCPGCKQHKFMSKGEVLCRECATLIAEDIYV